MALAISTIKNSIDGSNNTIIFGASSMQGYRDSQEDAFSCDAETSLFGVYDGHGGKAVAEYASLKLPDIIKQTEAYKAENYEEALKDGFLKFDSCFEFDSDINPKETEVIEKLKEIERIEQMKKDVVRFRYHRKNDLEWKLKKIEAENESEPSSVNLKKLDIIKELEDLNKEENMPFEEVMEKYKWDDKRQGDRTFRKKEFSGLNMPGWASGTTAVVTLIKDNKIYVANAGDSRCIISKNGEVVEMSIDHKINGNLDFSRALGDYMHKNRNVKGQEKHPLPDIKIIEVDPDIEFIFLASDGIWDAMKNKEVLDFVRSRIIKEVEPTSKICEDLFDHILKKCRNNKDNMTAIVVKFINSNLFLSLNKREDSEQDGKRKPMKIEDSDELTSK